MSLSLSEQFKADTLQRKKETEAVARLIDKQIEKLEIEKLEAAEERTREEETLESIKKDFRKLEKRERVKLEAAFLKKKNLEKQFADGKVSAEEVRKYGITHKEFISETSSKLYVDLNDLREAIRGKTLTVWRLRKRVLDLDIGITALINKVGLSEKTFLKKRIQAIDSGFLVSAKDEAESKRIDVSIKQASQKKVAFVRTEWGLTPEEVSDLQFDPEFPPYLYAELERISEAMVKWNIPKLQASLTLVPNNRVEGGEASITCPVYPTDSKYRGELNLSPPEAK